MWHHFLGLSRGSRGGGGGHVTSSSSACSSSSPLSYTTTPHRSCCCVPASYFSSFSTSSSTSYPLTPSVRSQPGRQRRARSAGLNVAREALLKAQGPISLVQMHGLSSNFHANRHVLFKQLWGYPQEEAPLFFFCARFLPPNPPEPPCAGAAPSSGGGVTNFRNVSGRHFHSGSSRVAFYRVWQKSARPPLPSWALLLRLFTTYGPHVYVRLARAVMHGAMRRSEWT